jgi:hypothetical protein
MEKAKKKKCNMQEMKIKRTKVRKEGGGSKRAQALPPQALPGPVHVLLELFCFAFSANM